MNKMTSMEGFTIRRAKEGDVPLILKFIKALAAYENLSDQVVASEENLRKYLFGGKAYAEVLLGYHHEKAVGFALYFHNFSTFLGRPGIYVEDLFVLEEERGKGYGKSLLSCLANIALERNCGRLEWAVLDWNKPSIRLYESLGASLMHEWIVNRLTGKELGTLASQFEGAIT